MKKKTLTILLTAAAAVFVFTGCKQQNVGTPEDNAIVEVDEEEEEEAEDDKLTYGYSCMDLDNPYYSVLETAIQMELEQLDISLLTKDPGSDPELQNQQIQELIDAGVDLVYLYPVDWELITPALEALEDADIPVINLDTQVKERDLVDAFIGSDNKKAGKLCGQNLIELMPEGGNVVILECASVNSINERITGFENEIANEGFQIMERRSVTCTRQGGELAMQDIIQSFQEQGLTFDAVMCGNDELALGAVKACEDAGITNVHIYGVGGSPDIKEELAKEGSLIAATGAQSPINIAKKAVEMSLDLFEGEDFKDNIYESTFLIDRKNVLLYGTNGWQ